MAEFARFCIFRNLLRRHYNSIMSDKTVFTIEFVIFITFMIKYYKFKFPCIFKLFNIIFTV